MRPQPEGRGERQSGVREGWVTPCGFNAATARRPWRTDKRQTLPLADEGLQCGHSPKAVEKLDPDTSLVPGRVEDVVLMVIATRAFIYACPDALLNEYAGRAVSFRRRIASFQRPR